MQSRRTQPSVLVCRPVELGGFRVTGTRRRDGPDTVAFETNLKVHEFDELQQFWAWQRWAAAAPVGLLGKLIEISLVLGRTAARTCSISSATCKPV